MEDIRRSLVPAPRPDAGLGTWLPVGSDARRLRCAGAPAAPLPRPAQAATPVQVSPFGGSTALLGSRAAAFVRPFQLPRGESVALSRPV